MTEKHTGTILVVDDSPSNVQFLSEVLMQRGHTVHSATDGMRALRSARTLLPDLILLDIVMPNLDGFKVCQFLKNSADTLDIPVIFMTSLDDTRNKIKGFELGAADYVTKPFQVEEVLARVETLLALRAMHKRLKSKNAELKLYQEQLEQLVSVRTAELAATNSHLQKEIAERGAAEERVKASLAEKEVLLKEVHHRVKNNLQIISTLLDLQSETIKNEEALRAFRESQDRIKAMALIHEKLYESSDIASIDFGKYVNDLSVHLFNSYLIDPGCITLNVDTGGISMGIDRAIPCGLIINELVSNALKHAFPDNRPGEISIRFDVEEDGRITLAVADNGIGMPEGIDPAHSATLGLQLVSMLARQLRGRIEMANNRGTSWEITFSSMEQGKRGSA